MLRPYAHPLVLPLTLVVLLLAACSNSSGDRAEATIASPRTVIDTTTAPPTTTTTAAPTTTTAPPTTTTTAAPTTTTETTAPAVSAPEPGEPWNVLFLAGRSDPIGPLVGELYSQQASASLGVDVAVEPPDFNPHVLSTLRLIRSETEPAMSRLVRDAEIIVVQTWPHETVTGNEFLACATTSSAPPDPAVYESEEYSEAFRMALGEIYSEIWQLREGTPTVLIGTDYYDPFVHLHEQADTTDACRALYEWFSGVQRQVAEQSGAIWVSLYDAINGPNHDIDAIAAGYLGATDQMPTLATYQPNEVGSKMIADALADAGYEPTIAP